MPANAERILASCSLFSAVSGPSRDRLVRMALLHAFSRGEHIFYEGDTNPAVYVVGSGLVRVYKLSPAGKEHVLHFAGPGSSFAEVAAIGAFPCPASAQAVEESTCAVLPGEEFRQALQEDHTLCLQLLGGMARWVHQLVGQLEDVTLRDAAGRLAHYLLGLGPPDASGVALPILKKDLASHLNLTSETLSRTLRRQVDNGLIVEDARGGLRITDRQGLSALANPEG